VENLGTHLILDYYGCSFEDLNDVDKLTGILEESVTKSGATLIKTVLHKFEPQGISGVLILAESHIAVHTWPEHGYAAFEIFMCGDVAEPGEAHRYIADMLQPRSVDVKIVVRGVMERIKDATRDYGASPHS